MRRTLAISLLTIRAAMRYRVVLVLAILLIGGVIVLPLIIKDDGTARGFTQIILTYTLTLTTALLGFATLWLSCGILAREIEEAQMQMVVVKPIARWQIWIGKWLGIMALNAVLLTIAGVAIYGLMQWRAQRLPAKAQTELRQEVLVARKAAREPIPPYQTDADRILQERLREGPPPEDINPRQLRQFVTERVKSEYQLVQPGYERRWTIPLGNPAGLKNVPMYIRAKFDPPVAAGLGETYPTMWQFGDPSSHAHYETNFMAPSESFFEFTIPPNLADANGVLHVRFINSTDKPLIFPLEDGLEVLYRTGGFGLNFARGIGVIFCWLALLAALGLAGASFLSFPVAAFCTIGVLFTVLSSGTLKQIIAEGGVIAVNPNTGYADNFHILNQIAVPVAKGMLATFDLARGFSPIDYLSSGRAITWGELFQAFLQICLLLGGGLAVIGIAIFTRRELATAQGTS
jgi:hypothetical protein